jgi:hypothetical protein
MEGVPRRDLRRVAEPGIPDHPGWISSHCGVLSRRMGRSSLQAGPDRGAPCAIRDREPAEK